MPDIFQIIALGIVEGLTEFLPISSTAHLTLASDLMGLVQTEFLKTFEIAIQAGAILAVLAVYWKKFLDRDTLVRVFAAFLPTAIIGYFLYGFIKSDLIGNIKVTLAALAIGGLVLIIFELVRRRKGPESDKPLSLWNSVIVGTVQAVAVIPGVSRSAATIVGGMALGVSRAAIVEFSFLLAVPTIGAASVLDLMKSDLAMSGAEMIALLVGAAVSFVTALVSIKFFLAFVRRRTFISFGIYRVIVAVLFAMYWI